MNNFHAPHACNVVRLWEVADTIFLKSPGSVQGAVVRLWEVADTVFPRSPGSAQRAVVRLAY